MVDHRVNVARTCQLGIVQDRPACKMARAMKTAFLLLLPAIVACDVDLSRFVPEPAATEIYSSDWEAALETANYAVMIEGLELAPIDESHRSAFRYESIEWAIGRPDEWIVMEVTLRAEEERVADAVMAAFTARSCALTRLLAADAHRLVSLALQAKDGRAEESNGAWAISAISHNEPAAAAARVVSLAIGHPQNL